MQSLKHPVTHHYQPTNVSCGYTALAILLSFYGINKDPLELTEAISPGGHEYGSLTAEVAAWCRTLALPVEFYSFDFQITDFSWKDTSKEQMVERLKVVEATRDVPSLGKDMSARYVRAYIKLLEAGASLKIAAHPSAQLIYKLLDKAPVYSNVCPKVLHGIGRARKTGLRQSVEDDIRGTVGTHSIVIYGNDEHGNLLLADPWDGLYSKPAETVVCAIMAAEIECDAQLFTLSPA